VVALKSYNIHGCAPLQVFKIYSFSGVGYAGIGFFRYSTHLHNHSCFSLRNSFNFFVAVIPIKYIYADKK